MYRTTWPRAAATTAVFSLMLAIWALLASEVKAQSDQQAASAPKFKVDPFWPQPLPNHWVTGGIGGVCVDAQDHVWIIHRAGSLEPGEVHATTNPPTAQCCAPAPPILEFDAAGNLIGHWGGPGQGYDWPDSNHGITVDYRGNVWIGGNGRGSAPGAARGTASNRAFHSARNAERPPRSSTSSTTSRLIPASAPARSGPPPQAGRAFRWSGPGGRAATRPSGESHRRHRRRCRPGVGGGPARTRRW